MRRRLTARTGAARACLLALSVLLLGLLSSCGGNGVGRAAVQKLVTHDPRLAPQPDPRVSFGARVDYHARCRPVGAARALTSRWSCDITIGTGRNFIVLFGGLKQHYDVTVHPNGEWETRRRGHTTPIQGCCLGR